MDEQLWESKYARKIRDFVIRGIPESSGDDSARIRADSRAVNFARARSFSALKAMQIRARTHVLDYQSSMNYHLVLGLCVHQLFVLRLCDSTFSNREIGRRFRIFSAHAARQILLSVRCCYCR